MSAQERSDSTKIMMLLVDDYLSLGNFDVEKHLNNCTRDYKLIENGVILDLTWEVEYFKSLVGRKSDRKDKFDVKAMQIMDKIAYAVYELRSSITEGGVTKKYQWIESAVFRKEDKWRIALIHSTRIEQIMARSVAPKSSKMLPFN